MFRARRGVGDDTAASELVTPSVAELVLVGAEEGVGVEEVGGAGGGVHEAIYHGSGGCARNSGPDGLSADLERLADPIVRLEIVDADLRRHDEEGGFVRCNASTL